MAIRHFNEAIEEVRGNIKGWERKIRELQEKSLTEMIDENYKAALEKSIKMEMRKLQAFMYVKRYLDMPNKKKKKKRWENQQGKTYPKEFENGD